MKKIGETSTGSIVVEMTADEFQALEQLQKPAAAPPPAAPEAVEMTMAERIEYAGPKILKLHPGKKGGVANSIVAMFRLKGGISEQDVRKTIAGLQKMGVLAIDGTGKVTYPKSSGAVGAT